MKYLDGKTEITDPAEVQVLEAELVQLAEETQVRHIPAYSPIPRRLLLADLNAVSRAVVPLNPRESAVALLDDERVTIPREFAISDGAIERILTDQTFDNDAELILKVKKPDYLGNSMWEFRHEGHKIEAKVTDQGWLQRFRRREETLGPGDAIRAVLHTTVHYDKFGEVVASERRVTKVHNVIPLAPGSQAELIWDDESESAG